MLRVDWLQPNVSVLTGVNDSNISPNILPTAATIQQPQQADINATSESDTNAVIRPLISDRSDNSSLLPPSDENLSEEEIDHSQ